MGFCPPAHPSSEAATEAMKTLIFWCSECENHMRSLHFPPTKEFRTGCWMWLWIEQTLGKREGILLSYKDLSTQNPGTAQCGRDI